MEPHLKIVGIILIALSLFHIVIPSYFKWKQETAGLSLITKQILYVHTFFIAFAVLQMGLLCLFYAHELITNPFGKIITMGLLVFWLARLFFQFFVYSPKLWRGKRFETTIHIIFSGVWIYITIVFLLTYLEKADCP